MSAGFARNALLTSVSQGVILLLGLGTSVLLARALGPAGRGLYALVALLAAFLVYFTSLGLGQAAVFYLGRRAYSAEAVLGHTLTYAAALGAVAVGAGWLVIERFGPALFPGVEPHILHFGLVLVPVQLAFGFLSSVLLGLQEIGRYNAVQVLRAGGMLAASVVLLVWLGLGVRAAVAAEAVAFGVAAVALFALARRRTGGVALRPDPAYVRDSLRFGLTSFSGSTLSFLHYRADVFLLNLFLNPATVGLYSVSAALSEKVTLLSDGVATVLFPRIAAEADPARLRAITPTVLRTVLLLALLAAAVLALASPWLVVALFSEAFSASVRPFQILLIAAVALSGWSILESDFKGRGRPAWCVATTAVALGLNVSLNLLWIPRFGMTGAAWASAVSYSAALAFALAVYCRVSGNRLVEVVAPRRADLELCRAVINRAMGTLLERGRRTRRGTVSVGPRAIPKP